MDIVLTASVMGGIAIFAVLLVITSFFVVEQQTNGVVERFGKFAKTSEPRLYAGMDRFYAANTASMVSAASTRSM